MLKFARGISSLVLKLSLFSFALAIAALLVFGQPTAIKKALSDSNIYTHATNSVIDSTKKGESREGGDQNLSLDAPEIRAAANEAFSPSLLKDSAEKIIDGTYRWLNKETAQPDFVIDLSATRQTLAQRLGDYASTRYASLPPCNQAQIQELSGQDIDSLSVPCQIPGVSPADSKQKVVNQIASSDEFLGSPVISADSLPKDESGKPFFEKFSQAPDTLEKLRLLPWVFGVLSLVSALALVFAHASKRAGLKSIAVTLLGTGIFLLVGALIIGFIFSRINQPGNGMNQNVSAEMRASLFAALGSLNSALQKIIVLFAAGYIAVGGAGLLALRFFWPLTEMTPEDPKIGEPQATTPVEESKKQ